jgi:hypothetical protein
MKTIAATFLALGLLAGAANAQLPGDYFTGLNQTAPKSVFEEIGETAPLSGVFGDIERNAP